MIDWGRLATPKFNASELLSITLGAPVHGFDEHRARAWVADHWYFAVQANIAYFFTIFSIKYFMRNRTPFELTLPLNIWNALLAIFSIGGSLSVAPDFYGILWNKGYRASYCDNAGLMSGAVGWWVWLFTISKIAEFVDTIFVVLRKKPLMFLHWYHHIFTSLWAFYSYPVMPAVLRWLIYLNYTVHGFMYSYYFLRSINVKIPGWVAQYITSGQIVQFILTIIALCFCGYEHYFFNSMVDCDFHVGAMWFTQFLLITILILFTNFYLQSYVFNGGKAKYKKVVEPKKEK